MRTVVEWVTAAKVLGAVLRGDRAAVWATCMCSYVLPAIITAQTLTVLLWICLLMPSWLVHISMVAICLWGPPMILALGTAQWNDEWRPNRGGAEPAGAAAAALRGGNLEARVREWVARPAPECHWPPGERPRRRRRGRAPPRRTPPGFGAPPAHHHHHPAAAPPAALSIPAEVAELDDAPKPFVCPITHGLMSEPAVTASGASYERAAISQWLRTHSHDPLTGRELRPEQLAPNLSLYQAIDEWAAARAALLRAQ
jgi:hypothetical protein